MIDPAALDETALIEAERVLIEDTAKPTTSEDGDQPLTPTLVAMEDTDNA